MIGRLVDFSSLKVVKVRVYSRTQRHKYDTLTDITTASDLDSLHITRDDGTGLFNFMNYKDIIYLQ